MEEERRLQKQKIAERQQKIDEEQRKARTLMTANADAMAELDELCEKTLRGEPYSKAQLSAILGDSHKASVVPLVITARSYLSSIFKLRGTGTPDQPDAQFSTPAELEALAAALTTRLSSLLTDVVEQCSELDEPLLRFLFETQRVANALKFPSLSAGWSLLETAWNSLFNCKVIEKDEFLKWKKTVQEDDDEGPIAVPPGWGDAIFQLTSWFLWLTKSPLPITEDDDESDTEKKKTEHPEEGKEVSVKFEE
eukprot:Selendium_serpulae@DN3641_c0_g1_i1.p1